MRLFLIRHAETVDNVASLYAGVRDSALTVHGNLQAERLAAHFQRTGVIFTHVFSSDLQRAAKTAAAICAAQAPSSLVDGDGEERVQPIQLLELREQNFGVFEGKPFSSRQNARTIQTEAGKQEHGAADWKPTIDQDVESKESMALRVAAFFRSHLLPLLLGETGARQASEKQEEKTAAPTEDTVAIVSHGIMLMQLWRGLVRLVGTDGVRLGTRVEIKTGYGATTAGQAGPTPLDHMPGWSNTGYMELELSPRAVAASIEAAKASAEESSPSTQGKTSTDRFSDVNLIDFIITIHAVNAKEHLAGLKRTKGGVGSAQHDEAQQKLDGFFKRRKL